MYWRVCSRSAFEKGFVIRPWICISVNSNVRGFNVPVFSFSFSLALSPLSRKRKGALSVKAERRNNSFSQLLRYLWRALKRTPYTYVRINAICVHCECILCIDFTESYYMSCGARSKGIMRENNILLLEINLILKTIWSRYIGTCVGRSQSSLLLIKRYPLHFIFESHWLAQLL